MEGRYSTRVGQEESWALTLNIHFARAQFYASHANSHRVNSTDFDAMTTVLHLAEQEG